MNHDKKLALELINDLIERSEYIDFQEYREPLAHLKSIVEKL